MKFLVKIEVESDNKSRLTTAHIPAWLKLRNLDSNTAFPVMSFISPAKNLTFLGITFLITKNVVEIEDDGTKVADT